jgi:triosephosphate isomerase
MRQIEMMSEPPIIVGNWKMNGKRTAATEQIVRICEGLSALRDNLNVCICPPVTLLDRLAEDLLSNGIRPGAQDCVAEPCGARTGDVNAEMLADLGARLVILGHSERRQYHGETDESVRRKILAAWEAGLTAVVCVGESLSGPPIEQAAQIVIEQLERCLPFGAGPHNTIIAYEPVWAIGTGKVPQNDALNAIHSLLTKWIADRYAGEGQIRMLYGGSVTPNNAEALMSATPFDGLLVGNASLMAESFLAVAQACASARS